MHLAVLSACRREYNELLGWLWSEIVFVNIINLNTSALLGNVILCLYKSKKNYLQYALRLIMTKNFMKFTKLFDVVRHPEKVLLENKFCYVLAKSDWTSNDIRKGGLLEKKIF